MTVIEYLEDVMFSADAQLVGEYAPQDEQAIIQALKNAFRQICFEDKTNVTVWYSDTGLVSVIYDAAKPLYTITFLYAVNPGNLQTPNESAGE